jgi:hypothetical protein
MSHRRHIKHVLPVLGIHMFLGHPESGSISTRYGSESFYYQAKNVIKTLISLFFDFFMTFYLDILSWKNDVNIASKSNKQKNF